jgi:1-acyl-sn-glycerol-3-phosphate acyltransferase
MSISSGRPSEVTTAHWLTLMAAWRRWFSYSVSGMEHLRTHECKIVVGYHGRPLAWDLFMLGAEIHREQGYLPLALVHYDFMDWPYLRWLTEGLQWTTGRGPILDEAIAKGRHVILAPGGVNEGLRPGWVRYRVNWPGFGYLRLAIERGLEVVPVASSGVDDAYFGLNDSERMKQRLRLRNGSTALWAGLGPLGVYPWSPPFPVRVHQIVGAPVIPVFPEHQRAELLGDREQLAALHEKVQTRVQELLDRARWEARHQPRKKRQQPISWNDKIKKIIAGR